VTAPTSIDGATVTRIGVVFSIRATSPMSVAGPMCTPIRNVVHSLGRNRWQPLVSPPLGQYWHCAWFCL
jgi:hypothetical protein